jgi:hypothetical protein
MNNKIAILLWLYHLDLTDEFIKIISKLNNICLFLGLCNENNNDTYVKKFKDSCIEIADINYYPNTGADLYSFINQLNSLKIQEYPYFIKIHSKKSRWGRNFRCDWKTMLIDSLIGSQDILNNNIIKLHNNNFGALGCGATTYQKTESVHRDKVRQILNILGLNNKDYKFIGGNMFMGDTKLYQSYIGPHKDTLLKLLSTEQGKVNEVLEGTYCHAMERVLGYIGCINGLESCDLPTITIKLHQPIKNLDYIHLRKMYNNDIYCIEDPNIYGKVTNCNDDDFEVLWTTDSNTVLSKYHLISNNTYMNQLYLDGGV